MRRTRNDLFKAAAYWFLNLVGLNAYYRRKNRDKIRVFALHGVGNHDGFHKWLPLRQQLDVKDFERFLKKLHQHYKFISIDDATKILKGEVPVVENGAVVTFDDGYLNNFTQALPILRKYKVPGVFYVATGVIESRKPFWFDRLDYVLQAAATQGADFEIAGRNFELDSNVRESVIDKYADLRTHCKNSFEDDEEFSTALSDLATALEQKTGVALEPVLEGDEWAAVVCSEQIRNYSADELVTFGGHTVSHLRLTCSSIEQVKKELTDSKVQIESWSGTPCEHFAYPNGDYDDACSNAVKAAGYQSAVTTDFGLNSVGDNVYTIKRLSVAVDCSQSKLLARASGLEEAVIRLTSKIKRQMKSLVPRSNAPPKTMD